MLRCVEGGLDGLLTRGRDFHRVLLFPLKRPALFEILLKLFEEVGASIFFT